jgi:hypothetical protein
MKDESFFDIEEKKQTLYTKIINAHSNNKQKITDMLELMETKISESDSVADAIVFIPKYNEIVEQMISNDQTLLKLFESLIKSNTNSKAKKIVEPDVELIDEEDEEDETFVSTHQDFDFEEVSKNLEKYEGQ